MGTDKKEQRSLSFAIPYLVSFVDGPEGQHSIGESRRGPDQPSDEHEAQEGVELHLAVDGTIAVDSGRKKSGIFLLGPISQNFFTATVRTTSYNLQVTKLHLVTNYDESVPLGT